MYRDYENPFSLEKYLCELQSEYDTLVESGADASVIYELHEDIETVKRRIDFAYEDMYDYIEDINELEFV